MFKKSRIKYEEGYNSTSPFFCEEYDLFLDRDQENERLKELLRFKTRSCKQNLWEQFVNFLCCCCSGR